MLPEIVRQKLEALPTAPGVYLFKSETGAVLYIGKARSLRSRVRSYFQAGSSDERFFIAHLAYELGDLETFVVANEKEAALLENELIKQHQPRYNVKLRDDKDFLSIRIEPKDSWPRLHVVRRPKPDGARYYGPYDSATSARQTLRLVNRFFKLRTCRDTDFKSRVRPCLQYQIKRCPAPCVMEVDKNEYLAQVDLVGLFLSGHHDELISDLGKRMTKASDELEYERAATYRDQLRSVDRVRTAQRVATVTKIDQDYVGVHRAGEQVEIALLSVRAGRLSNVHTFGLDRVRLSDEELLASFVREYYAEGHAIPDEIVLPGEIEAKDGVVEWLSEARGKRASVTVAKRGAKKKLLEMAAQNAEHAYREKQRAKEDTEAKLAEVQDKLRLSVLPRRIECIDVSHIGGTDTVAAITAMRDGALDRSRYRTFRVKRATGGDDYGAMYEVLARRLRRGREAQKGWELPDLLVVDGGKGQLNVALAAMRDLGVKDLCVVGLAKERDEEGSSERVFLPGQKNAIPLRERSAAYQMLVTVRDEAHRASNALRTKVGTKRRLHSELDDIPGIGPKTRTALYKKLGTITAIMAADRETLIAAGASKKQAEALWLVFHGPEFSERQTAPLPPSEQVRRGPLDPMPDAVLEEPNDATEESAEQSALDAAFEEPEA